jgi:bifunctional DNase/RNase
MAGRNIEIDSRPSDAIALAVRVQAPIFAEGAVLDKAGVALDGDAEERESREDSGESTGAPERLPSAFADFISTLDLDDLGRGGERKR